jgi:DNA-binding transcriptional LysR family regulator
MAAITIGHARNEEGRVESVYLKTLVEVVKAGSLSRAAEVLCVTQPAVSRRIKFLEEQYGCNLLDRSGSRIQPTEAGRMVFEKAKHLLDIEADLEAGLHRLEGKTRLSFSCTPAFGSAHLPCILHDFMLECADTADLKFLFLSPQETLRGLGEGIFDAGVIEGAALLDPATFTTVALPEAQTVFMTRASLDLPSPTTPIESLLELPLYTRREGCCSRMLLERGLKGLGLSLQAFRKVIVLDDLHLLIQAVLAGDGPSFLPTDLVQDHLAAGRMREHRIKGFDHARPRTLVVNGSFRSTDPLGQFVKATLAHFALPPLAMPVGAGWKAGAMGGNARMDLLACSGCLPDTGPSGAQQPEHPPQAQASSPRRDGRNKP